MPRNDTNLIMQTLLEMKEEQGKQSALISSIDRKVTDLTGRVGTVEDDSNYNKGRQSIVAILMGAVGAVIMVLVQYFINKKN